MVLNDIGETKGGGLKYEVVLEEAKTKKMPRPKSAPAIRKYEDIEEKLKVRQTSSVVKQVKSTPQTMSPLDNVEGLVNCFTSTYSLSSILSDH